MRAINRCIPSRLDWYLYLLISAVIIRAVERSVVGKVRTPEPGYYPSIGDRHCSWKWRRRDVPARSVASPEIKYSLENEIGRERERPRDFPPRLHRTSWYLDRSRNLRPSQNFTSVRSNKGTKEWRKLPYVGSRTVSWKHPRLPEEDAGSPCLKSL